MGITNVLYNRSEFLEKAQEFLDACESSGWCIISIDIERFKLFNNWYGQEAGDILLQNISQYLLRVQQMKGYLAGYFGGDHFFMYIPDDEQLINLIYKTIRSYIGIHSQNEGFLPIIGIYPITEKHPDTATMCNNAQLAASEINGKRTTDAPRRKSRSGKQRIYFLSAAQMQQYHWCNRQYGSSLPLDQSFPWFCFSRRIYSISRE